MTKIIPTNTALLLQNAPDNGLVIRDFVNLNVRDRSTNARVDIGMWGGRASITATVINPQTGSSISRDYTGIGALLNVPPIPAKLGLEVRTIRLVFSGLSPEMLNAVRLYDPKFGEVEIHRGYFDQTTNQLADPAMPRFFGFVNKAPIKIAGQNGEGTIELECVSSSNILTRTSGKIFSDEFAQERSSDRILQYVDTQGDTRLWWGQGETVVGSKTKPDERFFKK